jgi:hypothetical protein
MDTNEYTKREVIIDQRKLTRFALLFLISVIILFLVPFCLLWGKHILMEGFSKFLKNILLLIIPIVVVHEGLHGFIWAIFSSSGFKSIKFGFNVALLSPYTHCNVPMKRWYYFFGGIAPLVIMGLIPAVYSYCMGNGFWLFVSAFCTWSSAGDILSCFYILKTDPDVLVLDHPDTLGFFIYTRN